MNVDRACVSLRAARYALARYAAAFVVDAAALGIAEEVACAAGKGVPPFEILI